jgi:DNA-binding SARP family transcriptional activator
VEFRILGPLEVVCEGEALPLSGAQRHAVLALPVIHAGERVSRDWLVDQLWGERPPRSEDHAVQVYVSGIRKRWSEGTTTSFGVTRLRLMPSRSMLGVSSDWSTKDSARD